MHRFLTLTVLFSGLAPSIMAQFHAYVGALDHESVTLAWGTTSGLGNTIGQEAKSSGRMTVVVGDKKEETDKPWIRIGGLKSDTEYGYRLLLKDKVMAEGKLRTWPDKTKTLTFFLIGDWGDGSRGQMAVAASMTRQYRRLAQEGQHVRFVLSTGDNLYGFRHTGYSDEHWEEKFFVPYAEILKSIPFYAVPGNHDGNESESTTDLAVYLDNFFFPGGGRKRWYHIDIGEFAEFFALDSTRNQLSGPPVPVYGPEMEQSKWLKEQLGKKPRPWRFAVFHHPLFTAGPRHSAHMPELKHWFEMFKQNQVRAVFAGHEHNFQVSEKSAETGGIQFVVSGAGGELRTGNVRRAMPRAKIAAWAPQRHFCIVQLTETEMKIWPVTDEPLALQNAKGEKVSAPIVLRLN